MAVNYEGKSFMEQAPARSWPNQGPPDGYLLDHLNSQAGWLFKVTSSDRMAKKRIIKWGKGQSLYLASRQSHCDLWPIL